MKDTKYAKEKLIELFNRTIESDFKFEDKLKNIDYFSTICRASANNQMTKIFNSNVCMFNYRYNNTDSVLILFAIPLNPDESDGKSTKHISERVMDIIRLLEDTFITLNYVNSDQVKEDKFTYLIAVKEVSEDKYSNE